MKKERISYETDLNAFFGVFGNESENKYKVGQEVVREGKSGDFC